LSSDFAGNAMNAAQTPQTAGSGAVEDGRRPQTGTSCKRADAQRNYDRLVVAAREAFTERGASASLEEIAHRAGVGIGTLYRHFPNRQALLEAVYIGEVDGLSRSAEDFAELAPWDALAAWLHRFAEYLRTKQALAHELLEYLDREAPLFQECRTLMFSAGEPLLARAQEAGVVRADTDMAEIASMVIGISRVPASDPATVEHILDIALDGLRPR
jgi:AcrR family transcriptional regulator